MAYDDIKPRGATKGSKPDAGGAVLRQVPVLGTVKNNIDPNRSGRIQVYIGDFGGLDPDDNSSWVTVSYMSPFFGMTQCTAPNTGYGEFLRNPASYGVWNSPPDIGSTVICLFINGDPNFGYYIGCVPEADALQMVPAIGGSDYIIPNQGEADSLGGATRLPATNINSNNTNLTESKNFLNEPKPVHSYVASILSQQGLIRDPVRGVIGTTAQRESPSRVGWGVSTPGRPIYEGGYTDQTILGSLAEDTTNEASLQIIGRRGGHSFVMDDGDIAGRDQLVRIRSALGHQILMSDDSQTLFIIHSNGQSWVELGKEGTIDMYATNSVNIRTQGDLNLHADNNININTKKNLNIAAENINLQSEKDFTQRVGSNLNIYAQTQYTVKVNGPMSMFASGEASYASSAVTFINGSKINLNSGSASTVPQEVKPIPVIAHTDALFDSTSGWLASPGSLLSIVSRAPTHQPYAMSNKGVDVKIDNNASAVLPEAPPPAVEQANNSANETTSAQDVPPVTTPVASTVPTTNPVSQAIDKGTSAAMVAQTAVIAATGAAKDAVKQGAAIVQTATGAVASIGKLAQSPTQLQDAGFLKPGTAPLINNIISAGGSLESALTPNMFTGKDGVNTLTDFTKNVKAQVTAQVTNFQQAQTQLTQSGVMTGTESPTQVAGVVMSTALSGLNNTVDFVKNAASNVTGAISSSISGVAGAAGNAISGALSGALPGGVTGALTGAVSGVTGAISGAIGNATGAANALMGSAKNLIAGGNIAGNLANNLKGSLSSIGGTLNASLPNIGAGLTGLVDATKGAAASAFAAITKSIPKLEAGKPQNVQVIAENAAKKLQDVATSTAATVGNSISGLAGGIAGAASGLAGAAGNAISSVTNLAKTAASGIGAATNNLGSVTSLATAATGGLSTANNLLQTATTIAKTAAGPAGNLIDSAVSVAKTAVGAASGVSGIAGGEKAIAAIVDNGTNLLNQVPGASAAAGLITAKLAPNLGALGSALPNNLGSNILSAASGLKDKLTAGLGDLANGKNSLADLVSSGLPASAAAALNSAISAVSSTGAADIKMPVAALNTTNRSEVDAQVGAVLGSSKIPKPLFNPKDTYSIADYKKDMAKIEEKREKRKAVYAEIDKQKAYVYKIRDEYQAAIDNNPPGDPKIVEKRELYYSEKAKWQKLINSLIDT